MHTFAGIISCLIWSSAVLVSSVIAAAFGALTGAGIELLLGGTFILGVTKLNGGLRKMFVHSRKYYLVCGFFWTMNFLFFWLAVGAVDNREQLVMAGLLNYLWPALTLLLSIPILMKKPTWILLPGLCLALTGIVLGKLAVLPAGLAYSFQTVFSEMNIPAYAFAIIDALAWGLYSNFSRRYANPEGSSGVPLFMLVASAPLFIAGRLANEESLITFNMCLVLLAWAIASSLAFLFWDIGMRRGSVTTISAFAMLIPLTSTIITAFLTGVGLTIPLILAAALVVSGSYLCGKGVKE